MNNNSLFGCTNYASPYVYMSVRVRTYTYVQSDSFSSINISKNIEDTEKRFG